MKKILNIFKKLSQPVRVSLILMLLCGLIFPLCLTGLAQVIFPYQANGSIITEDGKQLGSEHIGQEFTKAYFMKGRPSAVDYNQFYIDEDGKKIKLDGTEFTGPSSGSNNYAPSNPDLQNRVENDIEKFLDENPGVKREDIPGDLVTASGSGLDPHISLESAKIQVNRIVIASGLTKDKVLEIIDNNTKKKFLGIFGEVTVNVLGVNLDIAAAMGLIN